MQSKVSKPIPENWAFNLNGTELYFRSKIPSTCIISPLEKHILGPSVNNDALIFAISEHPPSPLSPHSSLENHPNLSIFGPPFFPTRKTSVMDGLTRRRALGAVPLPTFFIIIIRVCLPRPTFLITLYFLRRHCISTFSDTYICELYQSRVGSYLGSVN